MRRSVASGDGYAEPRSRQTCIADVDGPDKNSGAGIDEGPSGVVERSHGPQRQRDSPLGQGGRADQCQRGRDDGSCIPATPPRDSTRAYLAAACR